MGWLLLAGLTALFESLKDLFGKSSLNKQDVFLVSWALRFFALPIMLPMLFFIDIPEIKPGYWWALAIGGGMNIGITLLYMRAIQASDLSLTVPMVTFTPLFLLLTSPIILGEFPSLIGIFGMVMIVLGAYILNINKTDRGFFAPFRALFKEKGPRLMLLVAFLWSITSNVDKIGVENSSPMFWAITVNIFLAAGLSPIMLWKSRNKIENIKNNFWPLLLMGVSAGLVLLFQMNAIELTLVAYVISIKRCSAALSVIWGAFIFKEENLKSRLAGAFIMLCGVLIIGFNH